ncbi:MAG: EAL domain-containing protein [Rhizobiaceae bacterium]|nr:EAL domain-containing protein [Rhizobiaceae bacterium]
MTQPTARLAATDKLIVMMKAAYWAGLFIIAGMTMASYLLLSNLMERQHIDASVASLNGSQMALSQRILVLQRNINEAPEGWRGQLIAELGARIEQFERGYERLSHYLENEPFSGIESGPASVRDVLHGEPYQLDLYSQFLIANARQALAAFAGDGSAAKRTEAERSFADFTIGNATLTGYAQLERRIAAGSAQRLEKMLRVHNWLYYGTIAVIVLVALFIFRPMANMVLRKTYELTDARNSMAFIANHDGLTGLYNRAFLTGHFDTLLKGAQRRRERVAIIQIDLDKFKQINDTLGHAAGDYVLVATAQRMLGSCRASDVCVRLGGDEFVMLLNAAGTTEDINALAKRILSRINEPINYQGVTIMPGASAGIAVYPVDGDVAADLLVHADLALYAAKKTGGGTASFFSEQLRSELDHRKKLEADLELAIALESFEAYFQPQVSLSTSKITGVEALIRWNHPERGMVAPVDFLPIAVKTGLMPAVGRILMRKAIREAAGWHRAGIDFGRLAINVSGTELRENDFHAFLFRTLDEAGLPPTKLSLEIVESVILDDEKTGLVSTLRLIRAGGVTLELDDFGTGYASLSHVNPNEIDRLKIDRRFVQNIDANGDNSKIVRAITELARGLGISIIAEGAETEAELDLLQSIGCDQVQGYSIAFPMPGSQTLEWLQHRRRSAPRLKVVQS